MELGLYLTRRIMEEVLDNLIDDFSKLDDNSQKSEINNQLKNMIAIYSDISKKMGLNNSVYFNKFMHFEDNEQDFNELVYAYLKSIEILTGQILDNLINE